jgi:hypothetical protein
MRTAFDLRAQQSSAEHAVRDAVSTVGQREQHARPVLRVVTEQRQPVAGFGKCASPGERRLRLKVRKQSGDLTLQSRRLAVDQPIPARRDVAVVVFTTHQQPSIAGAAQIQIRP